MKNTYLQRKLRITSQYDALNQIEAFIEKICDDFHIYDAYYGNIMASNTLALEMCIEFAQSNPGYFDILFNKRRTGMFFSLTVYDCFLDFAKQFKMVKDKELYENESFSGKYDKMMMLRLLSDEILLNAEEESLTMVFHISGINDMLTVQRIELLKQYYSKLKIGVKQ